MLYLITYLVPIKRSQCLRGDQSRYILLYIMCIQELWLCVLSFCFVECIRVHIGTMTTLDTIYLGRLSWWIGPWSSQRVVRNDYQRRSARTHALLRFPRPLGECHGVTYYYFTYYCFIEYVCNYVMSTYINWHCPYCSLKRDGATRWARCDKLGTDDVGRGLQRARGE